MRFKNWLGKYSNLASRTRWVRNARRYLNRQAVQAADSFSTLGKSGYAARRWGASRRWSALAPARAVMRRLDTTRCPDRQKSWKTAHYLRPELSASMLRPAVLPNKPRPIPFK